MTITVSEQELLLFFAGLTALSVILLFLLGRDEKPGEAVQNRPPSGLTPAELGYAIDGYVDYSDVLSLLLDWAVRGYVKIRKTDDGGYWLVKFRELPEDSKPFEKYLFGWAFLSGNEVEARHYECISFRPILNKARRMISKSLRQGGDGIFTKSSWILKYILAGFTALPMLSSLALSFQRDMGGPSAVVTAGVVAVLLMMPEYGIIGFLQRWQGWRPRARAVILAHKLAFLPVSFAAFLFFFLREDANIALAAAAMASTVAIGLCAVIATKRTPWGRELLGQAEGLRRFIENAEVADVVSLQNADGGYFFSMLPYAYIFGLYREWSEKFTSCDMKVPKLFSGYYGYRHFSPASFSEDLYCAMCAFLSGMTFVPGRYMGASRKGWGAK